MFIKSTKLKINRVLENYDILKIVCTSSLLQYYIVLFLDEISKQLLDSEAKLIITQVSLVSRVHEALAQIRKRIPIIAIKEHVCYSILNFTLFLNKLIKFVFRNLIVFLTGALTLKSCWRWKWTYKMLTWVVMIWRFCHIQVVLQDFRKELN